MPNPLPPTFTGTLTVIARIRAKSGMVRRVRDALRNLVAPTRQEIGCLNYDLHQSADDPTQFLFYENWTSGKELEIHSRSPHILAFRELAKGLLEGPTEITFWKKVD